MNQQPCQLEHTYACGLCASEFITDGDSHYTSKGGEVLPNAWWPACSQECYVDTFFGSSDSDPNGILADIADNALIPDVE